MSAQDIPLWWVGLSLAFLLTSIVIGSILLSAFNWTANDWALPIFVGSVSGGFSLVLLFPALRAGRHETSARPPLVGKS